MRATPAPALCTSRWTCRSGSPALPLCTKAQDSRVLAAGSLWRPEAAAQRRAWRAGATAARSTDSGWLNAGTRNTGSGTPRGWEEASEKTWMVASLSIWLLLSPPVMPTGEWHPLSEGCWWVPYWRLTVRTQSGSSQLPVKDVVGNRTLNWKGRGRSTGLTRPACSCALPII